MLVRGTRLPETFSEPDVTKSISSNFAAVHLAIYRSRLEIVFPDMTACVVDARGVENWGLFTGETAALTQGATQLVCLSPLTFDIELTNRGHRCVWRVTDGRFRLVSEQHYDVPRLHAIRRFGTALLFQFSNRVVLKTEDEETTLYGNNTYLGMNIFGPLLTVRTDHHHEWVLLGDGHKKLFDGKFVLPGPRCVFLVRGRTIEHLDILTEERTVLASAEGKMGGIALPKNLDCERLVYVALTGELLILRFRTSIVPLCLRGALSPAIDLNPITFRRFPKEVRELVRTLLVLGRRVGCLTETALYVIRFALMNVPCVPSFFGRPTK